MHNDRRVRPIVRSLENPFVGGSHCSADDFLRAPLSPCSLPSRCLPAFVQMVPPIVVPPILDLAKIHSSSSMDHARKFALKSWIRWSTPLPGNRFSLPASFQTISTIPQRSRDCVGWESKLPTFGLLVKSHFELLFEFGILSRKRTNWKKNPQSSA